MKDNEKKLDKDIWIIALATLVGFIICTVFSQPLLAFIKNQEVTILLRTVVASLMQFSLAGLGIVAVCFYRKEKFSEFGLWKKGALLSIIGTTLCYIPYIIYIVVSGQFSGYQPLSVMVTPELLASSLPVKIIGMLLVALAWGFFEGFNYAVISQKINQRYPNHKINVGGVTCGLICILFHLFSTSFWGLIEILTTFIFVYGMVEVSEKTKNAWGCVVVFCLLWNAF
ncbi:uncharacterized membrane protein YqaE (UPF0057 family) [Enterococcus sp. PF1-24]|uniref:hypothetical protein n=1 Tax=unclassified Enterococcus TaxID=2608891 RepID=UPI00247703FF|nr:MULTISPECIES: hypothetical protein [unclassified Enterococcus]MDH6363053.1 uncharacterized membrane protein YqaE (UPF0057 family) [Enterococcus sp. PFB1-1]MDH6400147.1 uncharacterized membrane protein YqaE (UPF0057 family) [Enterococcus sp. PF1-24]